MIIVAALLFLVIVYLLGGIVMLIQEYLPWMYDDAEVSQLPPSIYQEMAWSAVFLWPRYVLSSRKDRGH